jgi:hypothetical protein
MISLCADVAGSRRWCGPRTSRGGALPPPLMHTEEDARRFLFCACDGAQGTGTPAISAALALLLAGQHTDNLSRLETLLSEQAHAVRTASEDARALGRVRLRG